MRLGRRPFVRQTQDQEALPPGARGLDKQSVLMAAVITLSSIALLGTTEEPVTTPDPAVPSTTYSFARGNIDGGSVDLTAEQPRVTYYINIQANALGPDGVVTTGNASATLEGTVTNSGLSAGMATPYASFRISSSSGLLPQVQTSDHYSQGAVLTFSGDCNDPTQGQACRAQLALEIARSDDGAAGGALHVEWHFSVVSSGSVPSANSETHGPSVPPWLIEVTR
jgi:hypothetical protein